MTAHRVDVARRQSLPPVISPMSTSGWTFV
jgi:hypothetical protein